MYGEVRISGKFSFQSKQTASDRWEIKKNIEFLIKVIGTKKKNYGVQTVMGNQRNSCPNLTGVKLNGSNETTYGTATIEREYNKSIELTRTETRRSNINSNSGIPSQ